MAHIQGDVRNIVYMGSILEPSNATYTLDPLRVVVPIAAAELKITSFLEGIIRDFLALLRIS